MKKALLIDLGNVLVRFDHELTVRRVADAAKLSDVGELRSALFGPLEREFDLGRLEAKDFFRAVERSVGLPRLADDVWIPAWRDIFDPIPEALALLGQVVPGTRIVLVSNTNSLHWEGVLAVAPIDRLVEATALSFELGAVKPDPRIFRHALGLAGVTPADAAFADDRPSLVAAALELGIDAFEAGSVAGLTAGLTRHGLLPERPSPGKLSPS